MRLLWCKLNNYSIEELEPDLVDYKPQFIDIEKQTLIDQTVPLVLTGLTLRNYRSYDEFYVCQKCGKVYWQGTHWQRRTKLKKVLNDDDNDGESDNNDNETKEEEEDDDDGIVFYDALSTL